jgi:hypothetical protein
LNTIADSPVLRREGFTQNVFEKSGDPVPTVEGMYRPSSHDCHGLSRESLLTINPACTLCAVTAWTFAKQKWQRTKGANEQDDAYRTAQILPGFREEIYV